MLYNIFLIPDSHEWRFFYIFAVVAGLYIHIPFCARKCLYCGFYSVSNRFAAARLGSDFADSYIDTLLRELDSRRQEISEPVATLYIGGGSPSMLPPAALQRLADGIRERLGERWQVGEFTLEANPEQTDLSAIRAWKAAGVNRLSLGVQSFSDTELRACGRRHSASEARQAARIAIEEIGNVNLDLIFGLPGQTLASWEASLAEVTALRPSHVSAYALMFDEGTAFSRQLAAGSLREMPEDESERMYVMLAERLAAEGYEHYEVSNFSLPGLRSRHNSSYWTGTPYLGLGPGAHSYDGLRRRRENPADVESYIKFFSKSSSDRFYIEEVLTDTELREEMILTRMRTREGLPLNLYGECFGKDAREALVKAAASWIKRGMVEYSLDRSFVRLTRGGVMLSDAVILSLADF